jgi:RNA polymerase sigma-70 factor, ECF subfamily
VDEPGTHWCRALYEVTSARLILYGRALGLSHAESEDVLQETFMSLLRLGEPPRDPGRYCVRAFRNRALNHRRGWLRRLTRELESRRWFEGGDQGGWGLREQVAVRAMEALPPEQREVVVLRIWHGFTFEAIGEVTGVTGNTAAGRYRYALVRLRAALKGASDGLDECVGARVTCLEAQGPFGPA